MIICLTKTTGGIVVVNFDMVTFIEDCDGQSEVYFPYASISVKESIDEITRKVDRQKLIKEIRR